MTVKRTVTSIVVFLAFVAMTSVNVGTATAEPELPACQTNPWRSEVVYEFEEGSWAYFYQLIWCVEGGAVTWAVPVVTPVLPDDSECSWMATKANSLKEVPDSDSWLGFNMGWFSCPGETDDYPWGIVLVQLDGTSVVVDQGTA